MKKVRERGNKGRKRREEGEGEGEGQTGGACPTNAKIV